MAAEQKYPLNPERYDSDKDYIVVRDTRGRNASGGQVIVAASEDASVKRHGIRAGSEVIAEVDGGEKKGEVQSVNRGTFSGVIKCLVDFPDGERFYVPIMDLSRADHGEPYRA